MLPRPANTSSDSESLLETKLYPSETTRRLDRQLSMMPAAPEHHDVTTIAAPNQVPRADGHTDSTPPHAQNSSSLVQQLLDRRGFEHRHARWTSSRRKTRRGLLRRIE